MGWDGMWMGSFNLHARTSELVHTPAPFKSKCGCPARATWTERPKAGQSATGLCVESLKLPGSTNKTNSVNEGSGRIERGTSSHLTSYQIKSYQIKVCISKKVKEFDTID